MRMELLDSAPLLLVAGLVDEGREPRAVHAAEGAAQHVDLGRHELGRRIDVEGVRLEVGHDLGQQAARLALHHLVVDVHHHGRVDVGQVGLGHARSVRLVLVVEGVRQRLVDVHVVGDAARQRRAAGRARGAQVQVLHRFALERLRFVAERFVHDLVHRLDALHRKVALARPAADDARQVDVLDEKKKNNNNK